MHDEASCSSMHTILRTVFFHSSPRHYIVIQRKSFYTCTVILHTAAYRTVIIIKQFSDRFFSPRRPTRGCLLHKMLVYYIICRGKVRSDARAVTLDARDLGTWEKRPEKRPGKKRWCEPGEGEGEPNERKILLYLCNKRASTIAGSPSFLSARTATWRSPPTTPRTTSRTKTTVTVRLRSPRAARRIRVRRVEPDAG